MRNYAKLLKDDGWYMKGYSPSELKGENSFTNNQILEEKFERLTLLRDAYNGELINKDKFILEVIKVLNNE